jgi:signal recognition particle GTPase
MEEALQVAKVELGEDAMLVDSKRLETPPGGRPRLEVIFAAPVAPPPPPKVAPLRPPATAGSIAGLQRFRGELTNLLDALNRKPDAMRLEPMTPARPQLEALRARLLLSETPSPVVEEILQRCRPVLEGLVLRGGPALEDFEKSVQPLLAAEWPHAKSTGVTPARVLAFVGPTGAGKTSAIAKLAFRLGVSQARPVSVLSIDNLRIGASDQLAHLCSLLGVSFQSLDYSGGLAAGLAASAHGALVLVDTPGYGSSQGDVMEETAWHLARVEAVECHLVLPATMRYSELQRRHRQFAAFSPSRLLFTRLDETELFGPAWALSRESRMPVDWVSTGPGIPEDIEEADASKFAAAILGIAQQTTARASAARAGGPRS